MWRGKENLGMDEEPHRMDIKHGPGLDPQRMGHPPTVQDLPAPTAQGSILDPGSLGVVEDAGGVGHSQHKSTLTFCVGHGGRRIRTRVERPK
jgi:hypothetical protein